ncbi:MAG: hypothetical protein FWC26_06920 [Fibromonadales bacterium]|nr:hypothetical protein [Fibromonadales bacterium]
MVTKINLKQGVLPLTFFMLTLFATNTMAQQSYNFYFLPPSDPEWTWNLGTPFIVWMDNGLKTEKLDSDDSRCGWFKKTWLNATPPNAPTLIWLNNPPNDQLGLLGLEEDPMDWMGDYSTPFNLLEQFNNVVGGSGDLFFIPSGSPIWSKTDQNRTGACSFPTQKNSLIVQGNAAASQGAKVCVEHETSTTCGEELGNILDYYMLNRRGDQMNLSPSNSACKRNGDNLECYGGVVLFNYYSGTVGAVAGIRTRAPYFGLMGSYKVYAQIKDERADEYQSARPALMTSFTAGTMVSPVWGNIYGDDGKLIYNLGPKNKSTVSGKLIPIGFATGSWSCEEHSRYGTPGCTFEVFLAPALEGGSYGQFVNITQTANPGGSNSGLRFFTDSLGINEVQINQMLEIPGPSGGPFPGLLVLWVTGAYEAAEDETYTINDKLQITVYLSDDPNDFLYIGQKTPTLIISQEAVYYNLKGKPLGKQKPKTAGAYIVRQNGENKIIVVR